MEIIKIKHIKNYMLEVVLEDDSIKLINLENFLKSSNNPTVKKYLNVDLFSQVYLDETGAPCWGDNEFDINPISILNDEFAHFEND